jgi:hypothetical protein
MAFCGYNDWLQILEAKLDFNLQDPPLKALNSLRDTLVNYTLLFWLIMY